VLDNRVFELASKTVAFASGTNVCGLCGMELGACDVGSMLRHGNRWFVLQSGGDHRVNVDSSFGVPFFAGHWVFLRIARRCL
jgi:hypothetical protein